MSWKKRSLFHDAFCTKVFALAEEAQWQWTPSLAAETCRIQNPNIPRAVRVGAAHGGAAGRGGAGQNRTPTGRVAQKPAVPLALQGIVDNCPERFFASANKGNPMQTDGGTKPAVDNRFIHGSSTVYPRFISGTASALRSWLLTSVPTPICPCKPFSCKACPGMAKCFWGCTGTKATEDGSRVARQGGTLKSGWNRAVAP